MAVVRAKIALEQLEKNSTNDAKYRERIALLFEDLVGRKTTFNNQISEKKVRNDKCILR